MSEPTGRLRQSIRFCRRSLIAATCCLTTAAFALDLRSVPIVEAVIVDGVAVRHDRPIVLAPQPKRIEFQFTIPTFTAPEKVRFRYRLRGGSEDWIDAGHDRVARFTNLPPGSYEFTVAASALDGSWVATPTPIRVQLLPPFYRTAWFTTLCIAAAPLPVWLLHRTRMRFVHERQEGVLAERARIARELHDTMAQGLTGVTLHVEGAIQSLHDRNRATEYLETAKRLARGSLTDAERALFDLPPASLDGRDLVAALRHMLALMTEHLPVRGAVVVNGDPHRLAADQEKHLLRIAQEAVTNALRHAGARNIEILVAFQRSRVRLSVRDDGQGSASFSPDRFATSRRGVRGMRERAELIGARFEVRRNGGGMEIVVEVPA